MILSIVTFEDKVKRPIFNDSFPTQTVSITFL